MTNATDLAIRRLNEFIEAWVAPAAQAHLGDDAAYYKLVTAIRAIAPAEQTKGLGYAIFGLKPETRERRRDSGFETVVVSAVFDKPPHKSFVDGCRERTYWSNPDHQGLIDFGICQLQQIPT
jgi:hypothetical protein